MMPAGPPKATDSSTSTPDAFISVPVHPRCDISICIIPDAAQEIRNGKWHSIAQDTISDKAVGRLRGVRDKGIQCIFQVAECLGL